MQLFSNLKLVAVAFIGLFVLFLILLNRKPITQPEPYVAPQENTSTSNYLVEAQQRREQQQEAVSTTDLQAKRQHAKENSVECQFWKQQKHEKSPPKVDEKINEHCNL